MGDTLTGMTEEIMNLTQWGEDDTRSTLQRLDQHCKGNYARCYSVEKPVPVYRVVSEIFHSLDRVGEGGECSRAVQRCAPFYKGLERDLMTAEDAPHGTVLYRGCAFNFPNLNEYYKEGAEIIFYEPKSASEKRSVAEYFARS